MSSGPEPLIRLRPAKCVPWGMNAVATAEGGGMVPNGLASCKAVGFVLLESGWTVKGAASEFCKIF